MLTFARAEGSDGDAVLALYRACMQSPFTHWQLEYPSRAEIDADLVSRELWLLREDGALAGAASLLRTDDVEELGFPYRTPAPACVLGRFCLHPSFQGRGLAKTLLRFAEREARAEGYASMHLLCAVDNPITRSLYEGAGYHHVADAELYDLSWLVYEKALPDVE